MSQTELGCNVDGLTMIYYFLIVYLHAPIVHTSNINIDHKCKDFLRM